MFKVLTCLSFGRSKSACKKYFQGHNQLMPTTYDLEQNKMISITLPRPIELSQSVIWRIDSRKSHRSGMMLMLQSKTAPAWWIQYWVCESWDMFLYLLTLSALVSGRMIMTLNNLPKQCSWTTWTPIYLLLTYYSRQALKNSAYICILLHPESDSLCHI